MSDQQTPRARRSSSDIAKFLEKFAPQSNLIGQESSLSSASATLDVNPLRLPPELETYLPNDLWRKLNNDDPRRGLLNNALDRTQSLLYTISTYLPANLVQEKIKNPKFEMANGKMLRGCLLFSDVSGFTALSERLAEFGPKGAEHLTGIINQYFTRMIDILSRSNGTLLKFAGDATLVYFPEQEDSVHVQWAARAGLRMMRAMQNFTNLPTPQGPVSISMKVGLSAGSFLAASVGSEKRMEYALIGTTVSQTLQAEGCTSPGQIVANQIAADLLSSHYEMTEVKPGFFLLNPKEDSTLDEYEIQQTEKRKARGSAVQWDASPEKIIAEIKNTLGQINSLTPYLASELVDRIVAHAGQRHVQSEYRPTTVMFCNFTGPETLLEAWGEAGRDRVTKLLSEYFTDMNEVISRFGGIISRIDPYSQGTKLLALFGAPIAHEDDAQRAVSAALEMNNALQKLNRDWSVNLARYLPPGGKKNFIEHRIGITLGDTFAGQAGSSTRREYTVMGDEVNLAARLMSAARLGQILISEPVFDVTNTYYVTNKLPPVRVKGKKNPIAIFQVDGAREDTLLNRIQNRPALIGRTSELEYGWQIIQRARGGAGCVLTLTGQAGIGKSHLADTLLKQALENGWQVYAFQCRSYLTREAYSCWKGLLRSLSGITSIDHPLIQKEKLERLTAQFNLPDEQLSALTIMMGLSQVRTSNEDSEESIFNTEDLASQVKQNKFSRKPSTSEIIFKLTKNSDASKNETAQIIDGKTVVRLQEALANILSAAGSKKPLAVFFEDAQWIDAESKICLKALSKKLNDQPVIFLLALRLQETEAEEIGETIKLNPFSKTETRSMVSEILTAGLVDIIHEQSNGSPLFVEEISRWIKRTHSIDENRLKEVLQTSDVLQKLVLSRLESLPESQREVARLASVIGVEFGNDEVKNLLPETIDPHTFHIYLNTLINAGLITLSEHGWDKRYTFTQPIFREILYTSLPFERRRELHARVAENILKPANSNQPREKVTTFLIDKTTINPLQKSERLAYHYEKSEQWLEAAKQLIFSANTLRPSPQGGSETLYNRALALLENYPVEKIDAAIRLQKNIANIGLGDIAIQRGDLASGAAAFESALMAAPVDDISDLAASVTARLALLLPSQGKIESAEKQLTKIIVLRSKSDDWKLRGVSAWLAWRAGHDASSQIANCRACLPETDTEESLRVQALMDDLSRNWAQAAETYQMLGESDAAALAYVQLGNQFLWQRNPAEAAKQYDLASEIWQGVEFCGMALVQYRRAEVEWQARHSKKPLALLEEALSSLEKSPAALQPEARASIQKALTRVNKKEYGSWVYWPWQPFEDLSRIHLCFPLFQEL